MPLIETDTLYAFLNKNDEHYEFADKIMVKINNGKLSTRTSRIYSINHKTSYKAHYKAQQA